MDGFKDSTKTRYFSRPTEGFGYSKGGEVVSRNDMAGGQGPMNAPVVAAKYAKGGAVQKKAMGGACYAEGGKASKVTGPKGVAKVGKVMGEFGKGELHSGSSKGPVVKNPKQAVAIALSEGRKASKMSHGGKMGYKRGGSVGDKNMQESTSARPTGRDIAPVDRLEGRETPRSVTVRSSETTVVPGRDYRGRAGDIPVGPRMDRGVDVMPTDLDRLLRTRPSERGEMPMRRSSMRDYIPDFIEPALERVGVLGRKKGGLAVMPKVSGGKKGKC